jgi:hypothetical protein
MKRVLLTSVFVFLSAASLAAAPAHAAGCLKGAAVGGVAGHFAGHHTLLGAGAGCAIGHHEAAKHARQGVQRQQQGSTSSGGGGGGGEMRSQYGR